MKPFQFSRALDPQQAIQQVTATPDSQFLAGGTNLLDLMKEDVAQPSMLVDINQLDLASIRSMKGGVSIGSLATNTDVANHPLIRQYYPLVSQAILAGASAQIRNMATMGGNLNQRTRCPYFYDVTLPCNKRGHARASQSHIEPSIGCGARQGINRNHAIFGWSEQCVATHPSDMAVALIALDAVVRVQGLNGTVRAIPLTDYYRLPGEQPERDNHLQPGELIKSIELPSNAFATHSYYLKVRDRTSYAFALVSVAAAVELEPSDGSENTIKRIRLAMGGVAHMPWRALVAEAMLTGQQATTANIEAAAAAEMQQARPLDYNAFKVKLGERSLVQALLIALNGHTL